MKKYIAFAALCLAIAAPVKAEINLAGDQNFGLEYVQKVECSEHIVGFGGCETDIATRVTPVANKLLEIRGKASMGIVHDGTRSYPKSAFSIIVSFTAETDLGWAIGAIAELKSK